MTVAKKRRKRLFDAVLPLNYPRKASRDRSHSKLCDVNEGLVGAPSCYCKWYSRTWASSTKGLFVSGKSVQYNGTWVNGRRCPQWSSETHCKDPKRIECSHLLLNLSKDWAVRKRNNVSGSDVFNPLNNQLTIWKARNTSDPKNPSRYFLNPQI